jgi:hypothetical protein
VIPTLVLVAVISVTTILVIIIVVLITIGKVRGYICFKNKSNLGYKGVSSDDNGELHIQEADDKEKARMRSVNNNTDAVRFSKKKDATPENTQLMSEYELEPPIANDQVEYADIDVHKLPRAAPKQEENPEHTLTYADLDFKTEDPYVNNVM